MQNDPYAPPQSTMDAVRDSGARYSGFWQRVGAYLIDMLIVTPLILVDVLFGGSTHLFPLIMFIPGQCVALLLYVYMVRKYGATPGKMALGLQIRMVDGAPVTLKATLLRYAVLWAVGVASAIGTMMAALKTPDEVYGTLGYLQRSQELVANAPGWFTAVTVLSQIWVLACIVTMLANRERRSVHDFIAGTAVFRK